MQRRQQAEDLEDELRNSFIFRPPRFTFVFVDGQEMKMFNESDQNEEIMRNYVRRKIRGKVASSKLLKI